jgi:hypothetical protein
MCRVREVNNITLRIISATDESTMLTFEKEINSKNFWKHYISLAYLHMFHHL